jgi:hypothetical protein
MAAPEAAGADFTGRWRVRRISGLLPPLGVTKRIGPRGGRTLLFGIPVGRFVVDGLRFVYTRWPIVDVLAPSGARSDSFDGEGRLFGRRFCRFRLEPLD